MSLHRHAAAFLAAIGIVAIAASHASAQNAGPADVDFKMEVVGAAPSGNGDTFQVETFVVARGEGGQGWSYGVAHDPDVFEITEVVIGSDAEAIFNGGFNQTAISETAGVKRGFIQGIILSFGLPVEVPITDHFVMARASYTVGNVCDGNEITSSMAYSGELNFGGGPAIDVNFTVAGLAVEPGVQEGLDVTLCVTPPSELVLSMETDKTTILANGSDSTDIALVVTNSGPEVGVQAWSYGIRMDGSQLKVDAFGLGADAQAVKGGSGPDFAAHEELDEDGDSVTDALIGGAVVDFAKAQDAVLPLPMGVGQEIGLLTLSSAGTVEATETSSLTYDTIEGDGQKVSTIELLFTIGGASVEPVDATGVELTLEPDEGGVSAFIRGDANDDSRVNIADGIWIIQFLFYDGKRKPCLGAADANDDGTADIADAMYIFNYRLQPGATPGNNFPAPPAPFPGCGVDPDLSADDCPLGSTSCGP